MPRGRPEAEVRAVAENGRRWLWACWQIRLKRRGLEWKRTPRKEAADAGADGAEAADAGVDGAEATNAEGAA